MAEPLPGDTPHRNPGDSSSSAMTAYESLNAFSAQMRQEENARYARLMDARVNALVAFQAWTTKKNEQDAALWMKSDPAKAFREMYGVAASHGLLGGGSPVNMMYGLQQLTHAGNLGMMVNGQQGQLFGGGRASDELGRALFTQLQRQLYTSTGMANFRKTYGMNQDELGQIFGLMGSRGMMSGMNMGNMDRAGNIKLDEHAAQKIGATMTDMAKLFNGMKSLVGSRPLAELEQAMMQMTGLSLKTHSLDSINTRMEEFRRTTSALNTTPEALLQLSGNLNQIGAGRLSSNLSQAMNLRAMQAVSVSDRTRSAAVNAARERGDFIPSFSQEEQAAYGKASMYKMFEENPSLLEAVWAHGVYGDRDPKKRAALRESIVKMGSASNRQEREAAIIEMQKRQEALTGVSAGTFLRGYGTEAMQRGLSPEASDLLATTLANQNQSANANIYQKMANDQNAGAKNFGGQITSDQAGKLAHTFFRSFSSGTQESIFNALGAGDTDSVEKIIESKRSMMKAAGRTDEDINSLITQAQSNPAALSQFLREMQRTGGAVKGLADIKDDETIKAQREADMAKTWAGSALGDQERYTPGAMEQFLRGMTGEQTISDAKVLNYMSNLPGTDKEKGISSFEIKDRTVTSKKDAKEMAKVLSSYGKDGEFMAAMGLDSGASDQDIFDKMQSEEGKGKMWDYMRAKHISPEREMKDGKYTGNTVIANHDALEKRREELSVEQEAYQRLFIKGFASDKKPTDAALKTEAAVVQGERDEIAGLKDDPEKLALKQGEVLGKRQKEISSWAETLMTGHENAGWAELLRGTGEGAKVLQARYKADPTATLQGLEDAKKSVDQDTTHDAAWKSGKKEQIEELENKLKGTNDPQKEMNRLLNLIQLNTKVTADHAK